MAKLIHEAKKQNATKLTGKQTKSLILGSMQRAAGSSGICARLQGPGGQCDILALGHADTCPAFGGVVVPQACSSFNITFFFLFVWILCNLLPAP